jgi:HAD superfamily hydrolase (TIGR01509 family)
MQKFEDIEGLVFDYGGTLDSEGRHWSYILREGIESCGVVLDDDNWREAYVYAERYLATHRVIMPDDTFRDVMLKKIEIEISRLLENNAMSSRASRAEKSGIIRKAACYCYEYARENIRRSKDVLEKLHGKFPMVLVSNFYGNVETVLKDFGLHCYFSGVVESSRVNVRKPDPRIFKMGVELLGLEPHAVVVIGDSYDKDILPSASLGCRTIWLKGEGWNSATHDGQPKQMCADAIVGTITSLPALLL